MQPNASAQRPIRAEESVACQVTAAARIGSTGAYGSAIAISSLWVGLEDDSVLGLDDIATGKGSNVAEDLDCWNSSQRAA